MKELGPNGGKSQQSAEGRGEIIKKEGVKLIKQVVWRGSSKSKGWRRRKVQGFLSREGNLASTLKNGGKKTEPKMKSFRGG